MFDKYNFVFKQRLTISFQVDEASSRYGTCLYVLRASLPVYDTWTDVVLGSQLSVRHQSSLILSRTCTGMVPHGLSSNQNNRSKYALNLQY